MDKLTQLKDFILQKYSFFNDGYANVNKPENKQVIIDENMNNYVGIADNLGNYFYIRSLKKSTYDKLDNTRYSKITECRIVVVGHNLDDDILEQSIINSLVKNKCIIQSSNVDKTSVFKEETGTENMTNALKEMSIISVDFEVLELVNPLNCGNLNPCKC